MEYESDSLVDAPAAMRNNRLMVQLVGDLALAGGRLLPADSVSVRRGKGAIAGRVQIADTSVDTEHDLDGLAVFVNGQLAARTDTGGTFFVGGLQAGVYQTELDRENLPIELVPRRASITAAVAAGTVTRLDFFVDLEFGLAGRIVDSDGARLPGIEVELLDDDGQVVKTAATDRFGLYRIDGVPIGRYTLRVSAASGVAESWLPTRIVEIRDDFLFGQDLVLPGR